MAVAVTGQQSHGTGAAGHDRSQGVVQGNGAYHDVQLLACKDVDNSAKGLDSNRHRSTGACSVAKGPALRGHVTCKHRLIQKRLGLLSSLGNLCWAPTQVCHCGHQVFASPDEVGKAEVRA